MPESVHRIRTAGGCGQHNIKPKERVGAGCICPATGTSSKSNSQFDRDVHCPSEKILHHLDRSRSTRPKRRVEICSLRRFIAYSIRLELSKPYESQSWDGATMMKPRSPHDRLLSFPSSSCAARTGSLSEEFEGAYGHALVSFGCSSPWGYERRSLKG